MTYYFLLLLAALTAQVHGQSIALKELQFIQYPSLAVMARIEGIVAGTVALSPNGEVRSITLEKSHPLLRQEVKTSLKEWRFLPSTHPGRADTERIISVQVYFTIIGISSSRSPVKMHVEVKDDSLIVRVVTSAVQHQPNENLDKNQNY